MLAYYVQEANYGNKWNRRSVCKCVFISQYQSISGRSHFQPPNPKNSQQNINRVHNFIQGFVLLLLSAKEQRETQGVSTFLFFNLTDPVRGSWIQSGIVQAACTHAVTFWPGEGYSQQWAIRGASIQKGCIFSARCILKAQADHPLFVWCVYCWNLRL